MNRVAKNMDSVFANCTDSELGFETMFDDDDSLIDLVAGVNESGEWITGPNPEDTYEFQLDEDGNDPLTDKDDEKQREGTLKNNEGSHEGSTKDPDEKFESPEGMKSTIPGTGSSAESKSHEDDAKDAEQKALTNESNTPNPDGPLKDDDEEERKGKVEEATETCEGCGRPLESCTCAKDAKKKSIKEALLAKLRESDDMKVDTSSSDAEDKAAEAETKKLEQEAQKAEQDAQKQENNDIKESIMAKILEASVESRTDDTFEAELRKEGNKEDNLTDLDDEKLRDGKEKYSSSNVEAIKQKIIGATLEAIECGDCDNTVGAAKNSPETVPDDVQVNSSANNIVPDVETQSSDGLAPATEEVDFIKNKIFENLAQEEEKNFIMSKIQENNEQRSEVDYIKSKILESYDGPEIGDDISDGESVVYTGWRNVHESNSPADIANEDDTDDDADIEAIANGGNAEGELDLSVDYDDDELIDLAMSGKL